MIEDDPEAARRLIREVHRAGGRKLPAPEVVELGKRALNWANPDQAIPRKPGSRGPAPSKTAQQAGAESRRKSILVYGRRPMTGASGRAAVGARTAKIIANAYAKIPRSTSNRKGVADVAAQLAKDGAPTFDRTTIEDHLVKLGHFTRRKITPRF